MVVEGEMLESPLATGEYAVVDEDLADEESAVRDRGRQTGIGGLYARAFVSSSTCRGCREGT
jgi:hypothetical protein